MAGALEKAREKIDELRKRHADRLQRGKALGAALIPAAIGGGAHGYLTVKGEGKTLVGGITYPQAATLAACYLAYKNPTQMRYLGGAAGMVGAEASRQVEAAVRRADQKQQQQQQGAVPLLQQMRAPVLPPGVQMAPNVVPMAAAVPRARA